MPNATPQTVLGMALWAWGGVMLATILMVAGGDYRIAIPMVAVTLVTGGVLWSAIKQPGRNRHGA